MENSISPTAETALAKTFSLALVDARKLATIACGASHWIEFSY